MKPTGCPTCGSKDLAHARLQTHLLFGFLKVLRTSGAVCLTCGGVTTYLDEDSVRKAKEWKSSSHG